MCLLILNLDDMTCSQFTFFEFFECDLTDTRKGLNAISRMDILVIIFFSEIKFKINSTEWRTDRVIC